jgi:hypothetical protein
MIPQDTYNLPLLNQFHAFFGAGIIANQITKIYHERYVFLVNFIDYGLESLEV